MPNSARSKPSDNEEASAFREALHGRAEYISHKFSVRRANDIKPDYLQGTLEDLGRWSEANSELQRTEITRIRSTENQIYAAISLFEEPHNRNEYFATLRIIADQLKRI